LTTKVVAGTDPLVVSYEAPAAVAVNAPQFGTGSV
jgi:hypothetical protein